MWTDMFVVGTRCSFIIKLIAQQMPLVNFKNTRNLLGRKDFSSSISYSLCSLPFHQSEKIY